MSVKLDKTIEKTGTKFNVFPQPEFLKAFKKPETITISVPPDKIEAGPADDRFYVVDAINKQPYEYPYLPPHTGDKNPPVEADPKTGHFTYLKKESREFKAAHMYAIVRRVLDIWEDYSEKKIEWHFKVHYGRMELIPLIRWDNAHSGYGFLEFGYGRESWEGIDINRPYCMNYDVLAHELGHSIVFSEVGFPTGTTNTDEYGGFHEAAGDLVALVTTLHFDKVVTHLLDSSKGNLFTANEVSRIGELSHSRQIRKAFNYERMSTVSRESHDLSKPLTGALFDIFVEVFQKELVKDNLITQELADLSYHGPEEPVDDTEIQKEFDKAYQGKEKRFKAALLTARDYLGQLLATSWKRLSPHYLSYLEVGSLLLTVDGEMTIGEHEEVIRDSFAWREVHLSPDSIPLSSMKISECMAGSDWQEETEKVKEMVKA